MAAGLRDAGHDVVSAIDLHQGQPDHVWIPAIAAEDYVLVTRDQRIRRNPLEIEALWNARLRTFVLTANVTRPADTVVLLLSRMPKLLRICQRPGPFIFSITAGGLVTELPAADLRRRARGRVAGPR